MDTEYNISQKSVYWLGGQFNVSLFEWEWSDGYSPCMLFSC